MSNGLLAVNILLHDSILIDTNRRKDIQRLLVAGINTVKDEANDDLLPRWATLVPELRALQVDNIADVLHHTVQRARGEDLVFVVIGDGDQQFSVAVVHSRTQIVAVLERELVGVAGRSSVYACC